MRIALLILFTLQALFSLGQTDTMTAKKIAEIEKILSGIKSAQAAPVIDSSICYSCTRPLSLQQKGLVLAPILLFFVCMTYVLVRLKKEGFRFSDVLSENQPIQKTIPNPAILNATDTSGMPATIQVSDTPKSSSRFISFFSGMAAIAICLASVSYFFYMYFKTGKEPVFNDLYNILLALGIGIIPYTVNKVTDTFKKP